MAQKRQNRYKCVALLAAALLAFALPNAYAAHTAVDTLSAEFPWHIRNQNRCTISHDCLGQSAHPNGATSNQVITPTPIAPPLTAQKPTKAATTTTAPSPEALAEEDKPLISRAVISIEEAGKLLLGDTENSVAIADNGLIVDASEQPVIKGFTAPRDVVSSILLPTNADRPTVLEALAMEESATTQAANTPTAQPQPPVSTGPKRRRPTAAEINEALASLNFPSSTAPLAPHQRVAPIYRGQYGDKTITIVPDIHQKQQQRVEQLAQQPSQPVENRLQIVRVDPRPDLPETTLPDSVTSESRKILATSRDMNLSPSFSLRPGGSTSLCRRYYAGAGISGTRLEPTIRYTDGTTIYVGDTKYDFGHKFFVGCHVTEYLGFELFYGNFGKASIAPKPEIPAELHNQPLIYDGVALAGRLYYPKWTPTKGYLAPYVKVGGSYNKVYSGIATVRTEDTIDLYYALGATYPVNGTNIFIDGEYEAYSDSVKTLSLSTNVQF